MFYIGIAVAIIMGFATYDLKPSSLSLAHRKSLEISLETTTFTDENNQGYYYRDDAWWKNAVFYHIYLRSFSDSNSDGIGDLPGLISKLDYLSDVLGIDAILLSPIHPSPNKDFGYDVTDYYGIHSELGTIDDFRNLIRECKKRNIKVLLDLVVNHTSDQHPWFKESRSSINNPKRHWYLWQKGQIPPNNWQARPAGAGSSWKFDSETNEWYLHSFFDHQPDLNWRNQEVINEIKNIMEFWLNEGVSGFRLDLANYYLKDELFRDNPTSRLQDKNIFHPKYGFFVAQFLLSPSALVPGNRNYAFKQDL